MGKYIKCPRCELNYILEEEDYCPVCKAEMRIEGYRLLEEEEEGVVCPICKANLLDEGEKICSECAALKKKSKSAPAEAKEELVEEEDIITVPGDDEEVLNADGADFEGEPQGIEEVLEEELSEAGFFEVDTDDELGEIGGLITDDDDEEEEEMYEDDDDDDDFEDIGDIDDIDIDDDEDFDDEDED